MPKYIKDESFVIGQSQTGAVTLNETTLAGFIISGSVITGTTVTFLVSVDGTNFYSLYDADSTEVSLTTGSYARGYSLNPTDFMPWNFVKARLGTSASAVNQATYACNIKFVYDLM